MPLPPDFDETLAKVENLGITGEDPLKIRDRLVLAISTAAEKGHQGGEVALGDLGFLDWSTRTLRRCEAAIREEVCDREKQGLKDEYKKLLHNATEKDNLRQIGSLVTSVLAAINPSLAVSSVVVYFALWLARIGLNYWCKQPLPKE